MVHLPSATPFFRSYSASHQVLQSILSHSLWLRNPSRLKTKTGSCSNLSIFVNYLTTVLGGSKVFPHLLVGALGLSVTQDGLQPVQYPSLSLSMFTLLSLHCKRIIWLWVESAEWSAICIVANWVPLKSKADITFSQNSFLFKFLT